MEDIVKELVKLNQRDLLDIVAVLVPIFLSVIMVETYLLIGFVSAKGSFDENTHHNRFFFTHRQRCGHIHGQPAKGTAGARP